MLPLELGKVDMLMDCSTNSWGCTELAPTVFGPTTSYDPVIVCIPPTAGVVEDWYQLDLDQWSTVTALYADCWDCIGLVPTGSGPMIDCDSSTDFWGYRGLAVIRFYKP